MSTQWIVKRGEKVSPPLTTAQLKQYARDGKVERTDQIAKAGTDKWHAATKVQGLFGDPGELIPQSPPPVPATTTAPQIQPQQPQVNVNVSGGSAAANSLGIASLVLGIFSFFVCWIPFINFGLSGLGAFLGVSGIVVACTRRGSGIGYGIAGSAISLIGLGMGLVFMLTLQGMATSLKSSNDEKEKELAQYAPDSELVNEAPPLTFHGIGEPVMVGPLEVKISRAAMGPVPLHQPIGDYDTESENPLLAVWLSVTNTSETKKVDYKGWMGTFASLADRHAVLTDNNDNTFRKINFGATLEIRGAEHEASIYPGESISDVIVFEKPIGSAEHLNLSLSKAGLGEDGVINFRFPLSQIQSSR